MQVLLDNSSVLCNKLFLRNAFIYNKFRKFTHHFVLLGCICRHPGYTEQTPHMCGYTRWHWCNTLSMEGNGVTVYGHHQELRNKNDMINFLVILRVSLTNIVVLFVADNNTLKNKILLTSEYYRVLPE